MRSIAIKKEAASSFKENALLYFVRNKNSNYYKGAAAMAKYNIGVDYHKKFSYLVVKNKEGQVLREGQIQNKKKQA